MDEKTWLIIYVIIGWATAIVIEIQCNRWKRKHDDAITAWTIESNHKDKQILKLQDELEKVIYSSSVNPLVKVKEKVPNVSGNYLCYLANGDFEVLYFDRGIEDDEYNNDYPFGVWNTYPSDDGGECREWIEVLEVTHWQPLPEPPKDGE